MKRLLTFVAVLLAVGVIFTGTMRAGDNLDVASNGVIHDSFWDSRLFDGTPGYPGAILWFHNPAGIPADVNQAAFEARIENAFNTWDAVDDGIPGAPLVPVINFGGQTSATDPLALDGVNTVAWQPGDALGGTLVVTPCWALTEPTTTISDGAGHALMPVDGGAPIPFPGPAGATYAAGTIIDCGMRFDSLDRWSTAEDAGFLTFDVQAIATHEAGHFMGLSHSTLGDFSGASTTSATMVPFAAFDDLTFRTLEEDDKASVLRTYARNHFGGPVPQTAGGRGVVRLRLLHGPTCEPTSGVSVVAYRTSDGIDGPGRVEAFSGSQLRLGIGEEPTYGSVTLNLLPLPAGESYTIYARPLELGVGGFSSQRYNYTTINSNLLDPENQRRTFDQLATVDALDSDASINLGDIGIVGCWVADPTSTIDLVAQSVTAPNHAFRGSDVAITSTFKNNGSAATTAFSVGVYFSTDQTITTDDVFAGLACTVSSLSPGATGTCNGSATVPSLPPGDYYVGLLVDTENHIHESIETNNGISSGHATNVQPSPLNPIVNGSFETGDLTGWTVKELTPKSNPSLPLGVRGAGLEYPQPQFLVSIVPLIYLDYFTSAPTDGQWAVLHDFNGDDPATPAGSFVNRRELYQEVALPPGTTTLQFDYRAAWELFRFGSTQSRTFSVELEPAGGGATLFSQTVLDAPSGTYEEDTDHPSGGVGNYPPGNIDLSAFSGQNVRLKFVWNIPEPGTGFGFFQLDNIRLNATPSNTPPVVTVTSPANGSTFASGSPIAFAASANDDNDGNLSAGLSWSSSLDGPIGTGASFSTSALTVGTHTITASVTDSGSAAGSDSITVTVTGVSSPPPTVTVTAPNGGERVFINTATTIRWTATNATSFDVALSGDNGASYAPIAGCVALPGTAVSCNWTPAGAATATALIRVTANGSGAAKAIDVSNAVFSIVTGTPSITVTSPNTAVAWAAGSSRAITWNHNLGLNSFVRLELSRAGAAGPWEVIASSVANTTATTGTFPWIASAPNTATAIVRVSWIDGPANDVSNTAFSIVAPSIVVTAPNTNVAWGIGTSHNVTWTHNLGTAESVRLEASRDGGTTWSNIAASVPNSADTSGTFAWVVNGPATSAARVRASWVGNAAIQDGSDVNFRVTSPVTVTAPNTAVVWAARSTRTVTWTHTYGAGQAFDIDFSPNAGATWTPIAVGVPAATATTGTFTGRMPDVATTQGLIRVGPTGSPGDGDVSNVVFTLATPSVTVTAPNTNVNWVIGSTQNVTWTHNLGTAESVRLEKSLDGGTTWSTLQPTVLNNGATTGSFAWTVSGPATAAARLRAVWLFDGTIQDASNVNFRIGSRVTVTAPNTAVTWAAGSTRTVTWNHTYGAAQTFDVEFSPDNGATWTPIGSGVPAATATTGTFTVRLPATVTSQARIRVGPAGNTADGDVSDVAFVLAAPSIAVTAPNTNVNWKVGAIRSVTWVHNLGQAEQVNIEVSRDGGASWAAIATNVPNSTATGGTFAWTVTGPLTTTARVRVTWVAGGTTADVSDVNFRVQ